MAIKAAIDSGCNEIDLWDEHFVTMTKSYRAVQQYRLMKSVRRTKKTFVEVHYGSSGLGKSGLQWLRYPDAFPMDNSKFCDGYDGQAVLIFDDYSGGMPLNNLLRMLDRYPMDVEVKGAKVNFNPDRIIITSNLSPCEWYMGCNKLQRDALIRRIDVLVEYVENQFLNSSGSTMVCRTFKKGRHTDVPLPVDAAQLLHWEHYVPELAEIIIEEPGTTPATKKHLNSELVLGDITNQAKKVRFD